MSASFKEVLHGIAKRLDLTPSGLSENTTGKFAEFITAAMTLAWEFYVWPDLLDIREETLTAHPTVAGAKYIPRETADRNLRTVVKCYDRDPRVDECAGEVGYTVRGDGLYLGSLCKLSSVFVEWRDVPPKFTDEAHVQASAYVKDALVWDHDGTGHVYKALQAVPSNTVITNTAYWQKVTIPDFLTEPIKAGVIGAYKQAKGDYGTARVKLEYLREALEHEIEQFTGQSQQHQSY